MLKKTIMLALVGILAGCATLSNLDRGYALGKSPTASVVIIGVKPDYRFGVEEGTLVDDQFKWSAWATPIFAIYPKDGYVVAEMNATSTDQIYGLTNLKESIHFYRPCGNLIETFTVQPGKIIYLGDFEFTTPPVGLKHTIAYNPNKAERYIRENYPKLRGVPFVPERTALRKEMNFRQTELQWLLTTCN